MKLSKYIKYIFIKKDERGIEEDIISIKYKLFLFYVAFILLIIFITSLSISYFTNSANSFKDDVAEKRITNSSTEINKYISISLANKAEQLNMIKDLLENQDDSVNINEIVESYLFNSEFDNIGYILDDGYSFIDSSFDVKTDNYESSLTNSSDNNFTFDVSSDENSIYFCYLYDSINPDVKGIVGSITKEKLAKSFSSSIYNNTASILLVNDDGDIVINSSDKAVNYFTDNIITDFGIMFNNSFNIEEYLTILKSADTKVIELKANDTFYEVYTSKITNQDYINLDCLELRLVVMVPKEELVYQIEGVTSIASYISFGAISILLITVIVCSSLAVHSTIKSKLISAYDDKTGLLTIDQFKHDALALLKRTKKEYAFCYLNIINFKSYNQLHGVNYADTLIKKISKEINNYFRNYGIYSYFEADHFELCIEYENTNRLKKLLEEFLILLNYRLGNNPNTPFLSIGVKVSKYVENINIEGEIFSSKFANEMLKGNYHNSCISFFDDDMYNVEKENAEFIASAPNALINHEFEVYYQLKKNIIEDTWSGAEALVRWNKAGKGLILPGKFINLFEENGFIIELDLYVFEEVCKKLRYSIDNGENIVPISINLSKKHFINNDFLELYSSIIKKYGIPHKYIEFEITEGMIVENLSAFVSFISTIHSQGFLCSMDDFGSGYSSLNVVQELEFDVIKIDSNFFAGKNGFDNDSKTIVSAIIELSHKLGKKVVAEGIETLEQVTFLRENKCDFVQGFYFSKPLSWDDLREKLNNK